MIKIEHLVKNYGTNCAVDDISLEIGAGEIVGFLGPNGAGKSTTMNILTGYLSSTAGRVSVGGIDVTASPLEAKKQIGYLPEQPPLYLDMTVDEYLKFHYDIKGCTFNRDAHIAEICDIVKIGDVRRRVIRNLSKGYRQRVGIAGALVGKPKVLIFDEPTVGLDPKQIIEIRNLIRNLGREHTVILSTHILQEVQAVCDRIVIINKGRIVADEQTGNIARVIENNRRFNVKICGPQAQVLQTLKNTQGITYAEVLAERDGDSYTYTIESAPGVDIRKKLFFTLAERGWAMIGLEALGLSLEDIFITVVNKSDEKDSPSARYSRRASKARAKGDLESQLAESMVNDADKRREATSALGLSDTDDE
ncbi:MAG: ATP-binding cassette domain-containing protein [Ruminococcaceae bacterium]|nr:ATP-binding cassette domain-containing protein [Oscillospiraceae bacterium]